MPSGSCSLDLSFLYSSGKQDEKTELEPHWVRVERAEAPMQTARLHHAPLLPSTCTSVGKSRSLSVLPQLPCLYRSHHPQRERSFHLLRVEAPLRWREWHQLHNRHIGPMELASLCPSIALEPAILPWSSSPDVPIRVVSMASFCAPLSVQA